ncbi:DUF2798 domain-containing protein [Acidovorax kalamii]|uniref:DUF2798 domain-containing protein n=1 Tax=Acidovorax kalamii TaxID=2004485 RepID=A0A235EP24_9BURK|nr:DUF2798 domain-containing protein [Acidovorax kalamii]MCO5355351.1 DUF2798 domain-containing protein [Acidovorax kalamii]OYD50772.1 hypothetical protein CBY09_08575 [Acidovorax kalamii]
MIPARYGPALFSLILSGTMSLLVSGIATYRTLPPHQGFVGPWMSAWLTAWLLAFPAVMLAAPLARRAVARLTTPGAKGSHRH